MREDDYTGKPLGDDDLDLLAADIDLFEFDPDDELFVDEVGDFAENEQVIHFGEAANGAKTIREAAEKLYEFADELFTMSEEGWEIVDDVANGHGTAVRFDNDEDPIP
jgi:hypothetical protein